MDNKFNEINFLKCVRHISNIIHNVVDDKTAKNLIVSTIKHCGYSKDEVLSYIILLVPELLNKRFDIKGWRKIYDYFINNPKYPKFGNVLKDKQGFLKSEEDYSLCFKENAKYFSLDPDMFLNEIKLDCIGWRSLYITLIKMGVERGIKVEEPLVEKKGRKGRKLKKMETTKDKTIDETIPVSGETEVIPPTSPMVIDTDKVKAEIPKSPDTPEKVKTKSRTKRQYSVPVAQYKREQVFDTIESASEATGIDQSVILDCIVNRPSTKVERVWRYTDKKKQRIVLYTILHTYKSQNDIDKSSKEICGKKIYHNNIELKKWEPVYRGEYVWIQVSGTTTKETISSAIPDAIEESTAA